MLVTVFLLVAVVPAFAKSQNNDAQVFVVHGIPGGDLGLDPALPVDISVDGACALPGFTFGEIAGPISLPAGEYSIAIALANADDPCGNEPILGPVTIPFAARESASVVAYLTEDGQPTAGKFTNEIFKSRRWQSGLNLFHLAAAPAVDIVLSRGDKVKLELNDVVNGDQAATKVRPGRYDVSIAPAGSDTPVFETVLRLKPRRTYLVYAVGSVETGSFTVLVEQVRSKYWRHATNVETAK